MIDPEHPGVPIVRQCEIPGELRRSAEAGDRQEPPAHAGDRRDVPGVPGLRLVADDPLAPPAGLTGKAHAGEEADTPDRPRGAI